MSNYHLHKLRPNVFRLELAYTTLVLKVTGRLTQVWAIDVDGKPVHVTYGNSLMDTVGMIVRGSHTRLNDWFEEQAEIDQQRSEIAAEKGYELWLETRYDAEYDAMPEWAK